MDAHRSRRFPWLPALGAVATIACAVVSAAAPGAPPKRAAKPDRTGAVIWKSDCAPCHGDKGEGAAGYPKPLAGTRSPLQLAAVIGRTMPPGGPRLSKADAERVAEHAHAAFYSPVARERNRPARVALARLTVSQLRLAVSDLIQSFRPEPPAPAENGLRAEYLKARRFNNADCLVQRIDPEVRFDFGTAVPIDGQGFDPYQYSIRWQGRLFAPDTGEYEIVLHTDQAFRIWVNDTETPLIDAWVKSGTDTAFRAPIFLTGGRSYALRLEFSKSTQGVDDTKDQNKRKIPPAFVRLAWRRPKLEEDTIPARCLVPAIGRTRFVVSQAFPPDDRSMGYERGNSVTAAWDDAVTSVALDASRHVVANLRELSGVAADAPERKAKLMVFCEQFVERAFRRTLDKDTHEFHVRRIFAETPDPELAVRRTILLALKSPRFLYADDPTADDPWARASRLALTLWDTIPDETLRQAAASGALSTPDGLRAQAKRMAADPRATHKLRQFLLGWLRVDSVPEIVKDPKRHPGFGQAEATDLRSSLELGLDQVLASPHADFRNLLLSDNVYVNGRLAKQYGLDLPADAPFQPVKLDSGRRAGVLSHPYVLSTFAYLGGSSPIHRGVMVVRSVLGRTLAPPPVAVAPSPPDLHPRLTTRQRVELQTKPAACISCHDTINKIGFALENFDAIGKWRDTDNSAKVDARGGWRTENGRWVAVDGAVELARQLADSREVQSAFAAKCFQFLARQPIRGYGENAPRDLVRAFAGGKFDMRNLSVEAALLAAKPAPALPAVTQVSPAHAPGAPLPRRTEP